MSVRSVVAERIESTRQALRAVAELLHTRKRIAGFKCPKRFREPRTDDPIRTGLWSTATKLNR
ncbi:MAG: hypothetical protein HY788_18510 [Deltaproteobacteria bacterium]|nr:hypothetical protein [Deltaproteobacteria bacterium]